MPSYQVTLRNVKQPDISRLVEVQASSREQAASLAHRPGFRVALVKPLVGAPPGTPVQGVSRKEMIKLFRGLASMLKANINTADSLMYYAQGLPNQGLKRTLDNIRQSVEAGLPVHTAFAKEEKFDTTIITLIEAGADSGQLDRAFRSLADRIKTEMTFASKLKGALTVPILVILFQFGLFIWSQVGVVSKVEDTLKSVRMDPDPLSKLIFAFSHVVQAVWPLMVAALVTFIIAVFRSARFRQWMLELGMKRWRLLRQLVMGLRQTAYLGTLEMLYASGTNLARASALAARTVQGTPMYEPFMAASRVYESSGVTFAEALRRYTELDPQVIHMINIGEKSASLPLQLELLREIYEEDTAAHMSDFTQIVNFITLLIAVTIIAVVFSGSMLPIFLMGPRMMESGNM